MPKGITLTDDLNPNKSLKQALDKLLKQNTVTDISQQDSETNMNQDAEGKKKTKRKSTVTEATSMTEQMDIKNQMTVRNGVILSEVSAHDMKKLRQEKKQAGLKLNYQMVKKAPPF